MWERQQEMGCSKRYTWLGVDLEHCAVLHCTSKFLLTRSVVVSLLLATAGRSTMQLSFGEDSTAFSRYTVR